MTIDTLSAERQFHKSCAKSVNLVVDCKEEEVSMFKITKTNKGWVLTKAEGIDK